MTDDTKDGLTVAPGERGTLRVFDLTIAPEVAEDLKDPAALQRLVGAEHFDAAQADLFRVEDLGQMPLADYLAEAHDLPPDRIEPHRGRLNALESHVLVVRGRAFGGHGLTLLPSPELQLVALLREDDTDWTGGPIETESAKSYSGTPEPPRARRARARNTGGLIFVLFMALVAVIAWLILR
ncbi:MAG TPA: hypothetical protein DEA05_11180 [Rhodobacteraceae bacterium]|jgi:hypothetical protein|nr:hypothetical protein [Paracoccaceae bacterium]